MEVIRNCNDIGVGKSYLYARKCREDDQVTLEIRERTPNGVPYGIYSYRTLHSKIVAGSFENGGSIKKQVLDFAKEHNLSNMVIEQSRGNYCLERLFAGK